MEVDRKKSMPITSRQKEILIQYISDRQEMYMGKLTPSYTREKMIAHWKELTNFLNSVPQGPAKEWKQWRKTWVDIKKNTKAKAAKEKKYSAGTGGGPPLPPTTDIDQILNIISPVTIYGDSNTEESVVEFSFEDNGGLQINENSEVEVNIDKTLDEGENNILHMEHNYIGREIEEIQTQECNPPKKKCIKVNKTARLEKSLQNNADFLTINKEKNENDKMYQQQKIEILERDSNNTKIYQDKKIAVLQEISNNVSEILADFKEIKNKIFLKT